MIIRSLCKPLFSSHKGLPSQALCGFQMQQEIKNGIKAETKVLFANKPDTINSKSGMESIVWTAPFKVNRDGNNLSSFEMELYQ